MRAGYVGTAGWSIPRAVAEEVPGEGSHLERYARIFAAAEINSSFYRPHRASTYERWAASVPPHFRFSIKLPKTITHERRMVDCGDLLARFADEIAALGTRRGPVLAQLPPSFAFDAAVAEAFFAEAARLLGGPIVCEPRHLSWFGADADRCLRDRQVARVAADPSLCPEAARPGGWEGLAYYRWHGSPVVYRSAYDDEAIKRLGQAVAQSAPKPCWVIFDNTASGAAPANALALRRMLAHGGGESARDRT